MAAGTHQVQQRLLRVGRSVVRVEVGHRIDVVEKLAHVGAASKLESSFHRCFQENQKDMGDGESEANAIREQLSSVLSN
jgi:hypothetical protein